jgi:hypothetical protein
VGESVGEAAGDAVALGLAVAVGDAVGEAVADAVRDGEAVALGLAVAVGVWVEPVVTEGVTEGVTDDVAAGVVAAEVVAVGVETGTTTLVRIVSTSCAGLPPSRVPIHQSGFTDPFADSMTHEVGFGVCLSSNDWVCAVAETAPAAVSGTSVYWPAYAAAMGLLRTLVL